MRAWDVGVAETAICVIDLKGVVLLQTAVATTPENNHQSVYSLINLRAIRGSEDA